MSFLSHNSIGVNNTFTRKFTSSLSSFHKYQRKSIIRYNAQSSTTKVNVINININNILLLGSIFREKTV